MGRLSAIQALGGERVNFVFDGGGRLLETTMANGYNALYRYTAEGYLEEVLNLAAGGAEVSRHTYRYDPLGRRIGHLEAIAGAVTDDSDQYDSLDRLTAVRTDADATLVEAFAYDPYGNRRARTAADGSIHRYAYDAAQQLRQIRSGSDTGAILANYTYDLAGNLTQRSGGGTNLTLSYDALERLVAASGTGIAPETYVYDREDRRIETTVDGTPRRSVYAGLAIWSDYGNAWTQAQALYTDAGLDRPLIRTDAGGTAYYHADALGSVVAVTNAAGAITASARYDAFGRTLTGGHLPRYGYAGREPDATGLIYYRARYYDPTIGRFTQRDPAGFADGLNPYAYVGNNPISFTDPLGLTKLAPMASSNVSGYPGAVVGTTIAAQLPPLTTSLPIAENSMTSYVTPILQGGARALGTMAGAFAGVVVGTFYPSSLGNPEENWKPSDPGFLPFTSKARDSIYTADQGPIERVNSAGQPINEKGQFVSGAGGDSAAAATGRAAHDAFDAKVQEKADQGWVSKPRIVDADGRVHIPDALTPSGRPVEYKPNTTSGIRQGRRQLKRYENVTGKRGRLILYNVG